MRLSFKRSKSDPPPGAATVAFTIDGMHCNSCAMSIDWEVEELDGIVDASTSFARQTTVVTYDPAKVEPPAILSAIRRAGFVARSIDG